MTAFLAAHPALALAAVIAAALAVVALAVAVVLYATRDLGTRSSRPARRSPEGACEQRARAGKARAIFPRARAAALATTGWSLHTAARRWRAARTWWAFTRRRFERPLSADDRATLGLLGQMHEDDTGGLIALPAPGTTVKLAAGDRRAAIRTIHHGEFLAAPTNSPAAALPTPPAVAAAGQPGMLTIREDWTPLTDAEIACRSCVETDAGWARQADLGGQCPSDPDNYVPGQDEPGPESEPSGAPVPAPALDAFSVAYAEVRAIQDAPTADYLDSLARATAYQHDDATDSFAAIAAGWV